MFTITWKLYIFLYALRFKKYKMKGLLYEVWRLNALKRIYQRKGFANPHSCWSHANTTVTMWSIQLTLCGCRSIRYNTLCYVIFFFCLHLQTIRKAPSQRPPHFIFHHHIGIQYHQLVFQGLVKTGFESCLIIFTLSWHPYTGQSYKYPSADLTSHFWSKQIIALTLSSERPIDEKYRRL